MKSATIADRDARPTGRRRWSRSVVAFVALVCLAALSPWLGRDLPRRWVEARLSSMLDADVRLERFEIDTLHHFVLRGVEVERVRWESRIARLSIERIDVEAPIREALRGHLERLAVDGVGVRLVPPTRPPKPLPQSELQARRIEIHRGRLGAQSGVHEARLGFEAILTNWGIEPTGRMSFTAERFDPVPLLRIFGGPFQEPRGEKERGAFLAADATAERLRVDVSLQGGPQPLRVEAQAGRLLLQYGKRTLELRQPRLEATGSRDDLQRALRVTILPSVPGIEAAAVEAVLDEESYALRSGRGEFRGIEIETLLDSTASLSHRWTGAGRADLRVRTDDGRSFAYELDTRLDRLELALGAGILSSEDIEATARGSWRREAEAHHPQPLAYQIDATLGTLRIAAGSTELSASGSQMACSGKLDASGSDELRARVHLPNGRGHHENQPIPEDLFPIDASLAGRLVFEGVPAFEGTGDFFSPLLGRLQTRGRTVVEGKRPRAHWRWDWSDAPDLAALRRTASRLGREGLPPEVDAEGHPVARGSLRGALTDPVVQGQLTIEPFELAVGAWKLDRARASLDFSRGTGDAGRIGFDDLNIGGRLNPASGRTSDASWIGPLAVTARGWIDLPRGELQLDDARIDLQPLGTMQLQGHLGADRSISLFAQAEPVDLSEIRELSHLWLEDLAPDYTLQGTVTSRHEVRRTSAGDWHATGEVDLIGAGFGSRDGSRVLDGAEAHWRTALSGRPDGRIEGEATATVTGPIVLWGTLFGDFSGVASEVRVHARRAGDRWESTVDWGLPHGVTVRGRLAADPGGPRTAQGEPVVRDPYPSVVDYTVSVELADLSEFLDHYVRGPFAGSIEHLDTLGAAGRLRVDLAGRIDDTHHGIEGTVEATGASFSGIEDATAVEGLKLALPISLRWKRNASGIDSLVAGPERTGSLAYERLRLGGLEFPPLDTRLIVASDTVRLDRPLNLSLLDGHVELQQVALARWSRPDRDLRFGLQLDGLSLAALTRALDTFPLQGTLSGTFPAVHMTPDRLQVDGGGTIQVFGGAVEVFDISGRHILSRFPKLQFSAHLEGIRLLDVTHTFDFGEVYGVVSGEIRDCELFGGVPVRCEAELGSVKTKGVPQKISVKAIRNISILGAGARVGILDRGLQKFLDTYTYSRLGFTMKLDRDRFLLRGTERRGQSELFVKGRLPFRIDIVNAAPGQTVSFQTMMSRLQNLQVESPGKKVRKTTSSH